MKSRGFLYAPLMLILVLVISCVTEYQPDSISMPPALIVEGMITDQPGPYFVKLTRTADYSYKSLNLLETGATVIISDDLGNKETLTEQSPGGTYRTASMQGVAGRTYKLTIKTQSGGQYESDPEQIKASPPIGRLYYEYRYQSGAADNGQANGWDVYIDSKDPETPGDFYRWEWAHYEFTNICKLVYVSNQYEGIPCCSDCWDITRCYINCINIMSDVNINGNSISRQFIARVPYNSGEKYYLEVTQQRLSKGVYEFFKATRQQVTNTGGLFDAAPGSIVGNIHSVSSPGTPAYGYFGAVGQSVSHVWVDRSNAVGRPVYSNPVYTIASFTACIVCENSLYRTPVKPRWW